MLNKWLVSISFALSLIVALPVQADITIGLAAPLTGAAAPLGDQVARGARQAVADINSHGGINGEKIVLRESDDACDPKQAVSVANQFASTGVKFVVGHVCSSTSIPASKVYNEENIFMISPVSTNPALTDAGFSTIFRDCGRDDQQGAVDGNYILKHFPGKKIAVIHDNSTAGRGQAEQVKMTINQAGVKEVLFEAYTPGERDYSALVTKLKQVGVQVLFIGGYHTEAGLITRQIKEQGASIQIMGGDGLVTDEFWAIAGPAADGVLMSFNPDPRKHPEAKAALESIRKTGYEPEGYTLYGYAAVQVIAEGITRVGKLDVTGVAAAVRQKPINTVLGPMRFDTKGDVIGTSYILYRWHDGKYAEVDG
jgi:branched-chain amino acid transport system substrate-binding protein